MANPSPQEVDQYLKDLLKQYETEPKTLDDTTYRMIGKHREAKARAEKIAADLEQLRNQIKQGEARARSLELQLVENHGRADSFIDFLVESKFEALRPSQMPDPRVSVIPASESINLKKKKEATSASA